MKETHAATFATRRKRSLQSVRTLLTLETMVRDEPAGVIEREGYIRCTGRESYEGDNGFQKKSQTRQGEKCGSV